MLVDGVGEAIGAFMDVDGVWAESVTGEVDEGFVIVAFFACSL